jgi:hypothetical protein
VDHDELMARNTRAFEDLSMFLRDQTPALRGLTRAIHQHTDETVAEMQAQRQALFRIFDRLDGRGGEAAS